MTIKALKKNSRVKDYTVIERCGAGTYGEVWRAKHKRGSIAAIKSFAMLAQVVRQEKLLKEIIREASAQATVQHENVVVFHGDDVDRGCIIVEYLPNSLEQLVKERRDADWLKPDDGLDMLIGILEGLKAVHSNSIVHGDIKPANILLTERLTPKISDFGMASILNKKKFPIPFLRGSAAWAAPEVLKGEPPSFQADLFSVGVVAYVLFVRRHPFYREDPTYMTGPEDYIQDDTFFPKPLKEINPDIPDTVSRVVEKLLAREPTKRFQSVDEVLISLSEVGAPPTAVLPSDSTVSAAEIASIVVEAKRQFHRLFNTREALTVLNRAIAKYEYQKPTFLANAYSYKAFVLNYTRQWDEAIDSATRGIDMNPNHCDSYLARGYARMRKGEEQQDQALLKSAQEDLSKAQMLAPDYYKSQQAQKYLNLLASN